MDNNSEKLPPSIPHAIVVGGSLGGLLAALHLHQIGIHVLIFERSPYPLSGKGAGIALNPATIRFFQDHTNFDISCISLCTTSILYLPPPHLPPIPPIPCNYRLTSYNSFLAALLHHFPSNQYHISRPVVDITQTPEKVTVKTADGNLTDCDLLVCADGTESNSRQMLLGSRASPARYAGYVAWRGIVEEHLLSKPAFETLRRSFVLHFTPDGHIASYPIPVVSDDFKQRNIYINWLWYRNTPSGELLDALMTDSSGRRRPRSVPPGHVQQCFVRKMRNDLVGIPEPMGELIRATKEPFLQAVYDHESDEIAFGRVCLLGDAAYSLRPHIAAGTAKAADDARQLALAMDRNGNDVHKALLRYSIGQRQLGQACLKRSRELGELYQTGKWKQGQKLLIGLYEPGDSEME